MKSFDSINSNCSSPESKNLVIVVQTSTALNNSEGEAESYERAGQNDLIQDENLHPCKRQRLYHHQKGG